MTDDEDYTLDFDSDEELETTGPAPETASPATPTYKYYNDKFAEVHIVQALTVPDDAAALEYFTNVYSWFPEGHEDGRVKYVAVKRVDSDQYTMLAFEYDCEEDQVYTMGRQKKVEWDDGGEPTTVELPADEPVPNVGI